MDHNEQFPLEGPSLRAMLDPFRQAVALVTQESTENWPGPTMEKLTGGVLLSCNCQLDIA